MGIRPLILAIKKTTFYLVSLLKGLWRYTATSFPPHLQHWRLDLKRESLNMMIQFKSDGKKINFFLWSTQIFVPFMFNLWVGINIMLYSLMILYDSYGSIIFTSNLKYLNALLSSNFTLKINAPIKLKPFNWTVNGEGKYFSCNFYSFLTQDVITHRKIYPSTSQQNDIIEYTLRHIIEIRSTFLTHSNLLNMYEVNAFLTAVYVINHLLTPILANNSLFFKLFLKELNYIYI